MPTDHLVLFDVQKAVTTSHIIVCSLSSSEPFLSILQKVNFCQASNIFCMLAVFFCILKNYQPMQKMMGEVIFVYKFGQEFLIIGIFWKILYKYSKTILVKAKVL